MAWNVAKSVVYKNTTQERIDALRWKTLKKGLRASDSDATTFSVAAKDLAA